jgi:glycosyltransferase involved in cell wall biosynthesis
VINKPLVSICIPCYNAEKYIQSTIESIAQQTYTNIEIIIVDDGSIDNSVNTILKIKRKYYGTKISLYQQKNKGQCHAANTAFKNSNGKYIKFIDADDLINPSHIETQVFAIENNNHIAAGQVKRFYNNNIETALEEKLANWKDLEPIDWLLLDNGKGLGMMQCGMFLIPRYILDTAGLWNEQLSLINDLEFFSRILLTADKIIFTEEAKVFYRSGINNSLSNILNKEALKSAYSALCLTTNKILAFENSDRSRKVMANYWSLWTYHFYPKNKALFTSANDQILKLTGKRFKPDQSGFTKLLSYILGWKLTKRIKDISFL